MTDVQLYQLEADILMSKAQRRSKAKLTFLGRRSIRFFSAAQGYCRAAILFYRGGSMDESRKAFILACECYKKIKAWYSAAKTLEQAMIITTEQNNFETLTELSWRTAALYDMARQPDHAALILTRSGSIVRSKYPDQYIVMMYKAAEIVAVENRYVQAASYLKRIVLVYLDANQVDLAVPVMERIIKLYMQTDEHVILWQSIAHLTLLMLLLDEYGKSKSLLSEYSIVKGMNPNDSKTLFGIVEAFRDPNDCEKVNKGLQALESDPMRSFFSQSETLVNKLKGLAVNCKDEADTISLSLSERSKMSFTYSLNEPDLIIKKDNKFFNEETSILTNWIHPSMNPKVNQFDQDMASKRNKYLLKNKLNRSISASYGH